MQNILHFSWWILEQKWGTTIYKKTIKCRNKKLGNSIRYWLRKRKVVLRVLLKLRETARGRRGETFKFQQLVFSHGRTFCSKSFSFFFPHMLVLPILSLVNKLFFFFWEYWFLQICPWQTFLCDFTMYSSFIIWLYGRYKNEIVKCF